MAELQATQQSTQDKLDPRRFGRNNSGLNEQDVSDVVCILHPSSLAAIAIVNDTALKNPQHILQNQGLTLPTNNESLTVASEADTILLPAAVTERARDLALRFSSRVIDATVGFCFGRNVYKCDINLDPHMDQKRVSNTHFRIYLNSNGVLMLEDMSTNGTVVDGIPLGGKKKAGQRLMQRTPISRMLSHGSIIEVLSPTQDEIVKFILRVPTRDRYQAQFHQNFRNYVQHVQIARDRATATKAGALPEAHTRAVMAAPFAGPANTKALPPVLTAMSSGSPMHWDGGDKYNYVALLGKGAFALVYQIATTYSGEYYAAKELDKKRFMKNHQLDTRIENEMNIMQELRHDNIVQYNDFVETDTHLYIIMEFVPGGDLQGYMQSHGTLPEDPAKDMTRQILDALKYLHQKNITHRDIKPDNILLCSEDPFIVKLTDFGLSKVVKNSETFLKTFCGTLLYCAPEVFPHYQGYMAEKRTKRRRPTEDKASRRSYSQLVDIWSYAAVLWAALCGKPPFEGVVDAEGKGMFYQIMQSPLDTAPLKACGISDHACDLLLLMLDTDPKSRPSELECLRHPWLNKGEWLPEPEDEARQLHAIDEDEEVDIDASGLSINDRPGVQEEPASSGDSMEVQGRKRARGKTSMLATGEASPPYTGMGGHHPRATAPADPTRAPRLFGEISQPALQSSGVLNAQAVQSDAGYRKSQANASKPWNDSSNNSGDADSRILDWGMEMSHTTGDENVSTGANFRKSKANTSLFGATSMVRELQMMDASHLPSRLRSKDYDPEMTTRQGGDKPDGTPVNQGRLTNGDHPAQGSVDKTPRPRKQYERLISLPITASSYYDPYNPATHTAEYASRVSGHDFVTQPVTDAKGVISLPETVQASFRSSEEAQVASANTSAGAVEPILDSKPQQQPQQQQQQEREGQAAPGAKQVGSAFTKPQNYYGRLTSTADSFEPIVLPLARRQTTWGRVQGATFIYPNASDTRIPKQALELVFDAPGAAKAEAEGRDWTSLPGLRLLILTRSSNGIWVNGIRLLHHDDKGRRYYGRLTDGDTIEIFRPPHHAATEERPLKFTVDIGPESAKWQRTEGKPFEVQKHSEYTVYNYGRLV